MKPVRVLDWMPSMICFLLRRPLVCRIYQGWFIVCELGLQSWLNPELAELLLINSRDLLSTVYHTESNVRISDYVRDNVNLVSPTDDRPKFCTSYNCRSLLLNISSLARTDFRFVSNWPNLSSRIHELHSLDTIYHIASKTLNPKLPLGLK
jgi:hypothetical protein